MSPARAPVAVLSGGNIAPALLAGILRAPAGPVPRPGTGLPATGAAASGGGPQQMPKAGLVMRATIAYTTARILLFVAAAGLIYLAGARGLLLLGLALLVSGAASYILLTRQRDAMAGALSRRLGSFRTRLDAGTRAEDQD